MERGVAVKAVFDVSFIFVAMLSNTGDAASNEGVIVCELLQETVSRARAIDTINLVKCLFTTFASRNLSCTNYLPHLGCQSEIGLFVKRVTPVPSG